MAGFFIPDPRFEMPSLLEPGRKPVGPVEIDRSGVGSHVVSAILFNEYPPRNIVSDATFPKRDSSGDGDGGVQTVTNKGLVTTFDATGGNYGRDPALEKISNEFTLMVLARPRLASSDNWSSIITLEQGTSSRVRIQRAGSNTSFIQPRIWSPGENPVGSLNVNDGEWMWFSVRATFNGASVWATHTTDGNPKLIDFQNAVLGDAPAGPFNAMSLGITAFEDDLVIDADLATVYVFNKHLSDSEFNSVLSNPYKMLIPK